MVFEYYKYYFNILKTHYKKKFFLKNKPLDGCSTVPIGSILVNLSYQQNYNNPYILCWNGRHPTHHSEIKVINQGLKKQWDLTQCLLLVTCEPCPMCITAISLSKIPWVIFGCSNPTLGSVEGYNLLEKYPLFKPEILGGWDEDFWSLVLKNFFKNIKNKNHNL